MEVNVIAVISPTADTQCNIKYLLPDYDNISAITMEVIFYVKTLNMLNDGRVQQYLTDLNLNKYIEFPVPINLRFSYENNEYLIANSAGEIQKNTDRNWRDRTVQCNIDTVGNIPAPLTVKPNFMPKPSSKFTVSQVDIDQVYHHIKLHQENVPISFKQRVVKPKEQKKARNYIKSVLGIKSAPYLELDKIIESVRVKVENDPGISKEIPGNSLSDFILTAGRQGFFAADESSSSES